MIVETRRLERTDYVQVCELMESRFSTVVEYDKVRHKNFVHFEEDGFEEFKQKSIANLKEIAFNDFLNPKKPQYRIIGSFDETGKLMCGISWEIMSETEWFWHSIKARECKNNGTKETLTALFTRVKQLGLHTFYLYTAEYRQPKFEKWLTKLVPELYGEYERTTLQTIPAGSFPINQDIPEGRFGRHLPIVNLVHRKATLKSESK